MNVACKLHDVIDCCSRIANEKGVLGLLGCGIKFVVFDIMCLLRFTLLLQLLSA